MFLAIQNINISAQYNKLLKCISKNCFVIYFIHVWLLDRLQYLVSNFFNDGIMIHQVVDGLILSIATFIISLLVSILIGLVPYSQRLVG
ncbi:hypothetical protein [Rickettsia endosymbiont of Gonocerus acuteangulatus]|uniref:hypothetical protein n=1 Tax=Rickettsia endosymbiont of Gonocerus acuteangulatus TaxID=3066266 RepID=UPI00313334E1